MGAESEIPCYLCGEGVVRGDDYKIHVTIAHGVAYNQDIALSSTVADILTSDNVTPSEDIEDVGLNNETILQDEIENEVIQTSRKSFLDIFDAKVKQIMNLAEGKVEPISVKEDNVEVLDENQIWQMFENMKTKVMNMDISDTMDSKNIFEKEIILNSDDSTLGNTHGRKEISGDKKWYQGTFYECNSCQHIFYGREHFRKHLIKKHKIESKSLQNISEFSNNFDEKLYSCNVCKKKVKHEFKNIYGHLRTNHSLTLLAYETQYRNGERKQISDNFKSHPLNNFTNPSEQKYTSHNKLLPIKSELPNSNPFNHQSAQLRPVKSHAAKLQIANKSKFFDLKNVKGEFIVPLPSPSCISNNPAILKAEPVANFTKPAIPEHVSYSKLQPIKSELPKSTPSNHFSAQLRPVKSHSVKLQTAEKSQGPDIINVKGDLGGLLAPQVSTYSTIDPPVVVKEEVIPPMAPKPLSFYYCPMPGCSYYTTKEGMKKSQAALHLKNDHKIKAKDMQPGMYKFDKIKV